MSQPHRDMVHYMAFIIIHIWYTLTLLRQNFCNIIHSRIVHWQSSKSCEYSADSFCLALRARSRPLPAGILQCSSVTAAQLSSQQQPSPGPSAGHNHTPNDAIAAVLQVS